jgi:hypothetical protein
MRGGRVQPCCEVSGDLYLFELTDALRFKAHMFAPKNELSDPMATSLGER